MSRGGLRPGSGRKKGTHISKTAAIVSKLAEQGTTPLEYLTSVMNDTSQPQSVRIQCATAAAPYVHPKLSSVSITKKNDDVLQRLYEQIEREKNMKLIEGSPLPAPTLADAVFSHGKT